MVTTTENPGRSGAGDVQVSVVMPMRNAEPYVRQALESVLREQRVALEVVVVDDGSTDRSREIVLGLGDARVRVLDGPCRGFAASVNTGLKAARGRVVMQCDADDLYPEGRIATQLQWLDANPEYDGLCGAFSTIDVQGRLVADFSENSMDGGVVDISPELRRGVTRTSLCTWAIRRDAFSTVGWHREYFETSSDIDLQLRLGEACRIAFMPVSTYLYRLHDSSITHTQGDRRRAFFEDLARLLQGQRMETGTDDVDAGRPPEPPARGAGHLGAAASQISGMLIGQAWRCMSRGERRNAVALAWRATLARPSSVVTWVTLAKVVLRAATSGRHARSAAPKD